MESDSTLSRRRLSVISSKKRADQFSHTKRYFKRFFNGDVARHELKRRLRRSRPQSSVTRW